MSVMSAAITLLLPALAAVQHTAQGGDGPAGQLLRVTNEMWLLLSGVVNRETAAKAAEKNGFRLKFTIFLIR